MCKRLSLKATPTVIATVIKVATLVIVASATAADFVASVWVKAAVVGGVRMPNMNIKKPPYWIRN